MLNYKEMDPFFKTAPREHKEAFSLDCLRSALRYSLAALEEASFDGSRFRMGDLRGGIPNATYVPGIQQILAQIADSPGLSDPLYETVHHAELAVRGFQVDPTDCAHIADCVQVAAHYRAVSANPKEAAKGYAIQDEADRQLLWIQSVRKPSLTRATLAAVDAYIADGLLLGDE